MFLLSFSSLGFLSCRCWKRGSCKQGSWISTRGAFPICTALEGPEVSQLLSWWNVSGFIERFSHAGQALFSDLFLAPLLQCFTVNSMKLQIMREEVPNANLVTLLPHLSQVSDGCVRRRQRYPLLPLLTTDSVLMKAVVMSSHLSCQTQAPPSMNPCYDLH